jgi:hypothetical protein
MKHGYLDTKMKYPFTMLCHISPSFLLETTFFFFFLVLEFELRAYTLSHSTSPFFFFFVMGFFKIGSVNYLPKLPFNVILLISASSVAGITGVSHWHPAEATTFEN